MVVGSQLLHGLPSQVRDPLPKRLAKTRAVHVLRQPGEHRHVPKQPAEPNGSN